MDALHDLVHCITQRKLSLVGRGETLAARLYRIVKTKQIATDEAAAKALFGDNPHRRTYYNATRRKLKDLLYHTLLATTSSREDYYEKWELVKKKLLVADHLAMRGRSATAIDILREVFLESRRMHYIDTAHQSAQKLANLYAISGKQKKYRKFRQLEEAYWCQVGYERQSERYFFDLNDLVRHQKAIDRKVIDQVGQYHAALSAIGQDTFNFRMNADYISIINYELNNQGEQVVAACRAAMDFFENLSFPLPNRTHRFFTVRMIPALLQQQEYQEAREKVGIAEQHVLKGSRNWAGIQEYKAITGFHLQDLSLVEEAISALRSNRTAFAAKKEEVMVLEGYLSFFRDEQLSRFKIGKFLNEVPKYAADKKGMNINIQIIQILILLRRRKLAPIIDKMEGLRAYAYRHLKDDPATQRPDLFIRLLLLLSRYSFEKKQVQEKARPLLRKLQQEPRHLQAIDIEIVPYERLWEQILAVLD